MSSGTSRNNLGGPGQDTDLPMCRLVLCFSRRESFESNLLWPLFYLSFLEKKKKGQIRHHSLYLFFFRPFPLPLYAPLSRNLIPLLLRSTSSMRNSSLDCPSTPPLEVPKDPLLVRSSPVGRSRHPDSPLPPERTTSLSFRP